MEKIMNNSNIIYADPFLNNKLMSAGLPDDCFFVCAYSLLISTIPYEEAVFFRRNKSTDELWIASDDNILPAIKPIINGIFVKKDSPVEDKIDFDCVLAVKRNGEEPASLLLLLEDLFRARTGFCKPNKFLAAGVIDKPAFNSLVWKIRQESDENSRNAKTSGIDILSIIREFGISLFHDSVQLRPEEFLDNMHYANTAENSSMCG
jgi:hypothetical protein